MKAFLYLIRFYPNKKSKYPKVVRRLIVFGSTKKSINETAEKIFTDYKHSFSKRYHYHETGDPVPIDSFAHGKGSKKPINWNLIARRRTVQEQTRPRGQSSAIFHGLREEDQTLAPAEYRRILRDYISYALSTQKREARAKKMLFVGSTWDDKEKDRSGKAVIIEAYSLEESAYLCDLIFLKKKPVTTLVEWCAPTFDTSYKPMINERVHIDSPKSGE